MDTIKLKMLIPRIVKQLHTNKFRLRVEQAIIITEAYQKCMADLNGKGIQVNYRYFTIIPFPNKKERNELIRLGYYKFI